MSIDQARLFVAKRDGMYNISHPQFHHSYESIIQVGLEQRHLRRCSESGNVFGPNVSTSNAKNAGLDEKNTLYYVLIKFQHAAVTELDMPQLEQHSIKPSSRIIAYCK